MKNTLQEILAATSEVMKLSGEEILSNYRKQNLVTARQLFFYIAYENYYTYYKIGDFANRNHATVIHGHKKIKNELDYYPELETYINAIKLILSNIDRKWKNYHTIYNNINISHTL